MNGFSFNENVEGTNDVPKTDTLNELIYGNRALDSVTSAYMSNISAKVVNDEKPLKITMFEESEKKKDAPPKEETKLNSEKSQENKTLFFEMLKNISPAKTEKPPEEEKKVESPALNREKSAENKSKFFEMLKKISPDKEEKPKKHKFKINSDLEEPAVEETKNEKLVPENNRQRSESGQNKTPR